MNKQENNQKRPIYIVACPFDGNGLFSIFLVCLTHIFYAFKNGYIPIVDLKHYKNRYFKEGGIFKDNVWEYYFKQPSGLSLENIDKSDFSIIEHNEDNIKPYINILMGNTKKCLQNKKTVSEEKFFEKIELADEIKEYFEKEFDRLVKGEDFLGIICRGTDYVNLRPEGHQIQPEISDKKGKRNLQ